LLPSVVLSACFIMSFAFIFWCFYNRPFCCTATRVKKKNWTYLNRNCLISLGSKYWQNSDVWRDSLLVRKSLKTNFFHPPLFCIVLDPSVSKEAYNDVVSGHSCVEKNGEIGQRTCASLKCKDAEYVLSTWIFC